MKQNIRYPKHQFKDIFLQNIKLSKLIQKMSDIERFIENWGALSERHWHAMPSEALERLWIRSFSNFGVFIYAHFIFIFFYLWK